MSGQDTTLYAGVLKLSRSDIKALKITDAYSLHRVVYDLFDDVRSDVEKQGSTPSGILYADKGGDFNHRQILLLADRLPKLNPEYGYVETKVIEPSFMQHDRYAFQITINPSKRDKQSGKVVAVRGRQDIADWFISRSTQSWGFKASPINLQIENMAVQRFSKDEKTVTHGSASLKGELQVLDRSRFIQSFSQGIGRGRAFGFGLLQIVPI